jgi:2'-5' RNA ligase
LSWRVFAALELPPELQQQLARLQNELEAAVPPRSVRWVRSEGIHLTLRFYGDVEPERVPGIQAGLSRAAASTAPMALQVEGVGVFPNAARPTVIWAGVRGDTEPLQRLQAAVEKEAVALGFKPEERAYTPHLTLGRVNYGWRPGDVRRLMEALALARSRPCGDFTPGHLSLMNTELRAGGSVYTQLSAASLAPLERLL